MKTLAQLNKKLPLLLIIILLSSFHVVLSQNALGSIKGKITESSSGEVIPFANVILLKADSQIIGTTSDFDGKYNFKNINPGNYTIHVDYLGYQPTKIKNIAVKPSKTTFANIKLNGATQSLEVFTVIENEVPLIDKDESSLSVMPGVVHSSNIKSRKYRSSKKYRGKSAGFTSGAYDYQQPNFNTEGYAYNPENEFKNVKSTPLSTFSIDVDAASYSNMRRFINNGQNPPVDAVRVEEMINYFNYDYPQPTGEDPFSITTEMSDCPWNKKHKLIHIGLQGEKIETSKLPASNLVFLLDVSGSMSSYNKLPLLKKSFRLLVQNLTSKDRVAIVVYAGAAGLVLESTPGNEKEKIMNALNNLNAGGSTAGGAGIKLAYKIALENFIKEGNNRSEERRVGKECRSRWSPYH